ncbi:hypothetical protein Syun_016894 [Stephania yunnanensis]|uniref:Cupin type-1 domain-containing protein n=1 Tax=Stephania yunnanensis TaxID=152371 RepID=A0AAP0J5L5_9MAGN
MAHTMLAHIRTTGGGSLISTQGKVNCLYLGDDESMVSGNTIETPLDLLTRIVSALLTSAGPSSSKVATYLFTAAPVATRGLVFQKNNGEVLVAVIAKFNSQLDGTVSIPLTLFVVTLPMPDYVLTKTFRVGTKDIEKIMFRLAPKK